MAYRSFSLMPTFSNHLLSDRFTQMDSLFSRLTGEKPLSDTPAYNLLQDKENYELTVGVPGYTKEELDISVLNNQLTISGKSNVENIASENEKSNVKWLHQGIKKGDFSLSFSLDHRILIKQANLENGLLILTFTYDVPEKEKPHKITIGIKHPEAGCIIEHNTP